MTIKAMHQQNTPIVVARLANEIVQKYLYASAHLDPVENLVGRHWISYLRWKKSYFEAVARHYQGKEFELLLWSLINNHGSFATE